ncbi:MAG: diphthine--ammonia ligase [Candidatus Bilamarchaeum sp.]|jgi:ABC transporter with metal-binding/Fe-S-binding domain ATP-binding protein
MKVAVLFSGGKDSVFATFWAMNHGFEPILVTIKPPEYSMMFHHPNVDKTNLQAKALGLRQIFVKTTEENWREQIIRVFKKLKVAGIVAGAIASEYQRRRIDEIGQSLDIPTYAPLWHKDQEGSQLMAELLEYFEIFITAVSAEGLDEKFLAAPFRKIKDSKVPNIHPLLEGGEGETYVSNAPFFKKKIIIKKWKKTWDGQRGVAEIKKASFR